MFLCIHFRYKFVISKELIGTNLGYGANKDFESEINEARTFG